MEGRFGSACNETCPGETAVCRVRGWGSRIGSAHGECDDGMLGTGRCKCSDGFVGLSSVSWKGISNRMRYVVRGRSMHSALF